MMLSILLNFATGMIYTVIPAFSDHPELLGGLEYSEGYMEDVNNSISLLETSLNPGGELDDETNWFDRLLDKIGLGIIEKIKVFAKTYLFGFINTIQALLPFEGTEIIFNMFRTILLLCYALGIIWLFIGKRFDGE